MGVADNAQTFFTSKTTAINRLGNATRMQSLVYRLEPTLMYLTLWIAGESI